MLNTTVGQLLINDALPEELRDYDRKLDKKGLADLLNQVATQHPEQYREISHRLATLGQQTAQETGGMSFGIQHLRKSLSGVRTRDRIQGRLGEILRNPDLSDKARSEAIVAAIIQEMEPQQKEVYQEALAAKNPLALQVLSGARGSPMNLTSLLGSDLLYVNHRDQPVPIPILRSYSEGLTPWEYWAGTYGARKGTLATKFATQEAGFLSKQLAQLAHRLVVEGLDEEDEQALMGRGLPVDTTDFDNEGSLLATQVGPYPRNTVLTPKILKHLERLGHSRILIRSPLVGGSPEGGVWARDVGVRERGVLPGRGEQVGLTAAQALSEPLAQGQLCLAAGTLVRMADWTVRPIEAIRKGDFVLGADRAGRLFPVRVVRTYDNGERECLRTIFREAKTQQQIELISTGDHKLLAKIRCWAEQSERTEYGLFAVSHKCVGYSAKIPSAVDHDYGCSEPFAGLCGLLLGDGAYTRSVHGVHWSCFEPDLVAETQPYLAELGLKATKLQGHKGYYRISQLQDTIQRDPVTGRVLPGDRNPALIWLKQHRMYGKYAHEKEIPEEVWSWDQSSVAKLLGYLFATDGSVYSNLQRPHVAYLNFCSTSLLLAKQVKDLLRVRFAIYSSEIHNNTTNRKRPLYSFTITRKEQVRRFASQITIPGRKGKRLAEYLPKLSKNESAEYFHRQRQEPVGQVLTYDLEVDHPEHLFVLANGLIVSNSSKHSGGVAGSEKAVSGFDAINQLIQTPKHFKGGATHAQLDGTVQRVEEAPAGGVYVTVDGERHHVPQGLELKVKPGDKVEAGDVLSTGTPNPAEIVQHKGLGEGRRYFTQALKTAFKDANLKAHRRNIELLARGLINHVRLTEEYEDYVPDDVIPYNALERKWKARPGSQQADPKRVVGQYLEQPVLHYTIGTKIRPSMLKEFEQFGINSVMANPEPPPFEPEMIRGMASLQYDPDWMTRLYGSNLERGFLANVHRGGESNEAGSSFVPSLARSTDFGKIPGAIVRAPEPGYSPDEQVPLRPKPPAQPTQPTLRPEAKEPSRWLPAGWKIAECLSMLEKEADYTSSAYRPSTSANPYASGLKVSPPAPSAGGYNPKLDSMANTPAGPTAGPQGATQPIKPLSAASSAWNWVKQNPLQTAGYLAAPGLATAQPHLMKTFPSLNRFVNAEGGYGSVGKTIQKIPGLGKFLTPEYSQSAKPATGFFGRIAQSRVLNNPVTRSLGRMVGPLAVTADAGSVMNDFWHGRADEAAQATGQAYRDALGGKDWVGLATMPLTAPYQPVSNLNLLRYGLTQGAGAVHDSQKMVQQSPAVGQQTMAGRQDLQGYHDPLNHDDRQYRSWGDVGWKPQNWWAATVDNLGELGRLYGQQHEINVQSALLERQRRQLPTANYGAFPDSGN